MQQPAWTFSHSSLCLKDLSRRLNRHPPGLTLQAPSVKEEAGRKEPAPLHEPAARKMDVDEDYDDDGDDDKRAGAGLKGSSSRQCALVDLPMVTLPTAIPQPSRRLLNLEQFDV